MAFVLRFLAVVVFLCLTPKARAAPADSAPLPARTGPEKQYLDYRPTLIFADAAALGLFATAIALREGPGTEIAYAGAAVYVLGAPTVYLAHGQPPRSLVSLAMRVGLPKAGLAAGLVVGLIVCSNTTNHGLGCLAYAVPYAAVGFVGGGVAAMVVDDGFLGKVPIEDRASSGRKASSTGIASIVPVVDPRRNALGLSVVGAF